MTAGGDGTTPTSAVVWCGTCGIPYAAETAYCANCGAPLAVESAAASSLPVSGGPVVSDAPDTGATGVPQPAALAAPDPHPPLAAPPQEWLPSPLPADPPPVAPCGGPSRDAASPRQPRGLVDRVRQRQRAMSEEEIDAAAAAIIAQARHAERLAPATGAAPDALALLAGPAPDPVVVEALQRRRDRDRAWLLGGIACCILLIIVALVISRTMSVGMLRQ